MADYAAFRNNPTIDSLASKSKWTVSTKNKMPIDMYDLQYKGKISGAQFTNELSLVTLDALHQLLPDASNYAFYLDALIDKVVVLDIEPTCPDDTRQMLMAIPCLYCETSMSGKGVHMLLRLPEKILEQYPDARNKTSFQEKHKWFEILINHYVTFTGNQITAIIGEDVDGKFDKVFAELADQQKSTTRADIELDRDPDPPETQYSEIILEQLYQATRYYNKTLDDFYGNHSSYEFSFTAFLNSKLNNLLAIPEIAQEHMYTDAERAWFIYTVLSNKLTPRPKHNEERNHMPWLLYLTYEVIAKNNTRQKPQHKGG